MRFAAYVGIPYAPRGRDREGCDCWGLVRLVYAAELGIELPSHREDYADAADRAEIAALIAGSRGDWSPIAAGGEAPFDAILMRTGRAEAHIGLVTRPGWFLHVTEGGSARIERYRSFAHAGRVAGFHRHQARS